MRALRGTGRGTLRGDPAYRRARSSRSASRARAPDSIFVTSTASSRSAFVAPRRSAPRDARSAWCASSAWREPWSRRFAAVPLRGERTATRAVEAPVRGARAARATTCFRSASRARNTRTPALLLEMPAALGVVLDRQRRRPRSAAARRRTRASACSRARRRTCRPRRGARRRACRWPRHPSRTRRGASAAASVRR